MPFQSKLEPYRKKLEAFVPKGHLWHEPWLSKEAEPSQTQIPCKFWRDKKEEDDFSLRTLSIKDKYASLVLN